MDRRTFLAAMPFVAAGCARPAIAEARANSLRWASTPPITSIDPYYNVFREASMINGEMVWDTLIYLDPITGTFQPLLAKSWRWTDETTLDIELRENVKWHDGQPLTADDAVYTINYVTDPVKKVSIQSNVNWMKSAKKTGDLTFQLSLKNVFPPALNYLAGLVPIMPKDFFGTTGSAGAGGRLVGTGPYRIVKFTPGSSIDLERFDGYFAESPKGRPSIKTVNHRTIPDQATQIAELLSGGLDWIWGVPADQASRMKSVSNVTVVAAETMRISYLGFNTRDMDVPNPTKDRRVREAVACAIDRDTIIKHIVGEGSSLVRSACFRTQFGCKQDVRQYSYDPVKAKRLLAEAGYPNGVTLDFVAYRSREWTEAIVSYLSEVGIKTNVYFQEYSAVHTRILDNKGVNIFFADWGSYSINDTSAVLNNYFTLSADDQAQDKEVAAWVREAASVSDPARRLALYDKALTRIADETYWFPLWVHPAIYAHSKGLAFKAYSDENPRLYQAKWS